MSKSKKSDIKTKKLAPGKSLNVSFFIADEFRIERYGKIFAVGLYPDRVLVAQFKNDSPPPSKEKPAILPLLGMLFCLNGEAGEFDVAIKIGEVLAGKTKAKIEEGKSVNIVFQHSPFAIASFGKKMVSILVNEQEYNFDFEIRGEALNSEQSEKVKSTQDIF